MEELKVVISSEIVEKEQKKIVVLKNNFDSIETTLKETLETHTNAVYSEDSKQAAKKDVAEVRKGKKAFVSAFTEAKNELLEPAEEITPQYQRIVSLFREAETNIAEQVKKMEEAEKEEKKLKINEYFNEKIKGFEKLLSLEDIFDSKWLNLTTSMKKIKESIDSKVLPTIEKYERELELLKGMCTNEDVTAEAIETYEKTFDLAESINTIRRWEKQEAAILAREKEKQRLAEEQKDLERRQEEQRVREELEAEKKRIEAEKQAEIEKVRAEERAKAEQKLAFERAEAERVAREKEEAEEKAEAERVAERERIADEARIAREQALAEKQRNHEETYSVIVSGLNREQMEKLSETLNNRNYTVECRLEEEDETI